MQQGGVEPLHKAAPAGGLYYLISLLVSHVDIEINMASIRSLFNLYYVFPIEHAVAIICEIVDLQLIVSDYDNRRAADE